MLIDVIKLFLFYFFIWYKCAQMFFIWDFDHKRVAPSWIIEHSQSCTQNLPLYMVTWHFSTSSFSYVLNYDTIIIYGVSISCNIGQPQYHTRDILIPNKKWLYLVPYKKNHDNMWQLKTFSNSIMWQFTCRINK